MDLPTTPVIAPKPRGTSSLSILLGIAVLIAVGGVAFAAGRLSAPPVAASGTGNQAGLGFGRNGGPAASGAPGNAFGRGNGNGNGFGGAFGGANAGVTIEGKVTEIAADHLTIQLASGTTVQIPISSSTTYHRQADATSTDVQSGNQVLIRVQAGAGRGGGGAGASASPQPSASGSTSGGLGQFIGPASDITIVSQ